MSDQEKRRKDLVEAMSRERGGQLPPTWAYMADNDLDFLDAYNRLYAGALGPGKALPVKTRELIALAVMAFRGNPDSVYEHAKRALRHGATKQELLEAVETTFIPGGAPTFATGLRALLRIEEDEKKAKG